MKEKAKQKIDKKNTLIS